MSSTADTRLARPSALDKRYSSLTSAGSERPTSASPQTARKWPAVRTVNAAYTARTAIAAVLSMGRTWLVRWRERHELAELDDKLLVDIGCRRADAVQESMKPFWKP